MKAIKSLLVSGLMMGAAFSVWAYEGVKYLNVERTNQDSGTKEE